MTPEMTNSEKNSLWLGIAMFLVIVLLAFWAIVAWIYDEPIISPQPDNVDVKVYQETGEVVPATGSATPVEEPNVASPSSTLNN